VRDGARDLALGLAVVALVAGGLVIGAAADPPETPQGPALAPRFFGRTLYCPSALGAKDASARLVLASLSPDSEVPVSGPSLPRPSLHPEHPLVAPLESGPVAISGYGAALAGAVSTTSSQARHGAAAAPCLGDASQQWYFPGGSSEVGLDGRLLIYNPFPDEAVVRISLVTPAGEEAKAGLADVPVPAGEAEVVRINDFIVPRPELGAVVRAIRGRIVVWRELSSHAEGVPKGLEMSAGSPRLSEHWYFPQGAVGPDVDETLALLNPSLRQAKVTVALASSQEAAQPPRLVDLPVPPGTVRYVSLDESAPKTGKDPVGVSAVVTSTNGVPIVAERRMEFSGEALSGTAAEMGSSVASKDWTVLPASFHSKLDNLVLLNPGSHGTRVFISLVRASGKPLNPDSLQEVKVGAGLRVRIPLTRWTRSGPAVADISASAPIVAERWSYDGTDVADVMGVSYKPTQF
jgi:Family of unknown function (DUF5719)